MKQAIVVGSEGQDGRLLSELLAKNGRKVHGIAKGGPVDILDPARVAGAVEQIKPDEIYYLAAVHHSSQEDPATSYAALLSDSFRNNVEGLLNFLVAARLHAPDVRLFYASSSLVFGSPAQSPQDENTTLNPECIYGISKVAGMHCCRMFRLRHRIFAACGILYNHESIYRREGFVSRKIVTSAVRIKRGKQERLVLGDLSAKVDWGWAGDYVNAMMRILQLTEPRDFIVATGMAHSVQDFVEIAFDAVGLDWRKFVSEEGSIMAHRRGGLVGDSSRLRQATGWTPTLNFQQMVQKLVAQTEAADPR